MTEGTSTARRKLTVTPERRAQLVAQAALMRQRRAEKKTEPHVCIAGETDKQLNRLKHLLHKHAPDNIAPVPIATSMEQDDEGNIKWTVDVTVHIYRVTDYDIEATGRTLALALEQAADRLCREINLRTSAQRANRRFGLVDKFGGYIETNDSLFSEVDRLRLRRLKSATEIQAVPTYHESLADLHRIA